MTFEYKYDTKIFLEYPIFKHDNLKYDFNGTLLLSKSLTVITYGKR